MIVPLSIVMAAIFYFGWVGADRSAVKDLRDGSFKLPAKTLKPKRVTTARRNGRSKFIKATDTPIRTKSPGTLIYSLAGPTEGPISTIHSVQREAPEFN